MSVTDEFAKWMATPPQDGRRVEGVWIYANSYIGSLRFAGGIYEPATLPDENGTPRAWAPANIEVNLPDRRRTLEQSTVITFSGLRPDIVTLFDRLPPEAMAEPTLLKLYVWIIPTAMAATQITPPPRLTLIETRLSGSALELECSGPLLPNRRAGQVYTVEDFPGLTTE